MASAAGSDEAAGGIALSQLTPHLVCTLCGGYYVDATTIVECLHTFCRSCILRHLEASSYCPALTCDVMIHRTKGAVSLRPDATLQSIVYKAVPGLHRAEMHRRRIFYLDKPDADPDLPSFMKGSQEEGAGRFYAPDDTIDVRIQYASPRPEEVVPVRYLRCPAGLPLTVLKKFLFQKYRLPAHMQMELIHGRKVLPQDIKLLDVAYIVNWSRKSALKLLYRLSRTKTNSKRAAAVGEAATSGPPVKSRKVDENVSGALSPPANTSSGSDSDLTSQGTSSSAKRLLPSAANVAPKSEPELPAPTATASSGLSGKRLTQLGSTRKSPASNQPKTLTGEAAKSQPLKLSLKEEATSSVPPKQSPTVPAKGSGATPSAGVQPPDHRSQPTPKQSVASQQPAKSETVRSDPLPISRGQDTTSRVTSKTRQPIFQANRKLAHSYKAPTLQPAQKPKPLSAKRPTTVSPLTVKTNQKPKTLTRSPLVHSPKSCTLEKKMAKLSQAFMASKQALKSSKSSLKPPVQSKANTSTVPHMKAADTVSHKPANGDSTCVSSAKTSATVVATPSGGQTSSPKSGPTPTSSLPRDPSIGRTPGPSVSESPAKSLASACHAATEVCTTATTGVREPKAKATATTSTSSSSSKVASGGVRVAITPGVPPAITAVPPSAGESLATNPKLHAPSSEDVNGTSRPSQAELPNGRMDQRSHAPDTKAPVSKVDCSVQTVPIYRVHSSKQNVIRPAKTTSHGTNTHLSSTPRQKPSEEASDGKSKPGAKIPPKPTENPPDKGTTKTPKCRPLSGVLDLSTHSREKSAPSLTTTTASKDSKTIFVISGGKKVHGSTKIQSIVESLAQKRLQSSSPTQDPRKDKSPSTSTTSSARSSQSLSTKTAASTSGGSPFLVPSAAPTTTKSLMNTSSGNTTSGVAKPSAVTTPSTSTAGKTAVSLSVSSPLHIETYSSCLPPLSSLTSSQGSSRPVFPVLPLPQRPRSQAVHRSIPNPSLVRQRSAEERARQGSKGSPTAGTTAPALSPTTELHSLTRQLQEAGTSVTITNSTTG